jgi:pyruvate dehydrogenase E1 component beta subunit
VIDTPITEYGFAGIGTGAAMGGLRPIVEFMTFNFAMQAIDHIINSAAKTNYMSGGQMRCPVVFRGPNGAASRVGAQHSQNYRAVVCQRARPDRHRALSTRPTPRACSRRRSAAKTRSCSWKTNWSMAAASRCPNGTISSSCPSARRASCAKASDVTIVSYSIGVGLALEAAEMLAGEGIDAEVIDLRTLRPLDREAC